MHSRSPRRSSTFDSASLWLTRIVDHDPSPLPQALRRPTLLFGVPPSIVFVLYIILRFEHFSFGYLVSLSFLIVFFLTAPHIVWYYDGVVLPSFFAEIAEIFDSDADIIAISERYQRRFTDYWWVPSLVTLPTIPVLMFGGQSFVRAHGLFGATDVVFWLVLVALLWASIFVSIGFVMVYTTIGIVRTIATEELIIDPLHPDGLGGMSTIGYLSIRTTVMLSMGSLLLPLQFQYAIGTDPILTGIIYVNGVLYAIAIAVSFVYPTLIVNRRANELRERKLSELRTQYQTLKTQSKEPRFGASLDSTDRDLELKLQRIRQEYQDFQEVTLYPMELSIIVRLIGSVLLPVIFIFIDTLLRPGVLQELLSRIP